MITAEFYKFLIVFDEDQLISEKFYSDTPISGEGILNVTGSFKNPCFVQKSISGPGEIFSYEYLSPTALSSLSDFSFFMGSLDRIAFLDLWLVNLTIMSRGLVLVALVLVLVMRCALSIS